MNNNNENKETPNANAEAQQPNAEQPKDNAQQPAAPAPENKKPFYKKGIFWTVVGVVAAAAGVGAALWLGKDDVEEAAETATDAVAE